MDRMQFKADLVVLRRLYQEMQKCTDMEKGTYFSLNNSEIRVLLNMLNSYDSQTGALSVPIDDFVDSIYGKV